MKRIWFVALLSLFSSMAYADDPAATREAKAKPKATAAKADGAASKGAIGGGPMLMSQQDKMRYCAKQATGKKGDERRLFMKSCLSKKKA